MNFRLLQQTTVTIPASPSLPRWMKHLPATDIDVFIGLKIEKRWS